MKVTDLIESNKNRVTVSFEFIPPKKGVSIKEFLSKIEPLMEVNPLFVDVTTHRNQVSIKSDGANITGTESVRHPSTLLVCEAIRNKFNVETIPHVICGGFTREETQDLLIDMDFLGYDNIMCLRGDKLQYEKSFTPTVNGNKSAIELLTQVNNFNSNKLISGEEFVHTNKFCIGSSFYPEGHASSPCMEVEKEYTSSKMELSDFAISQMFFDNEVFYDFIEFPDLNYIPGIKVLSNERQLSLLPELFSVSIPEELCKDIHIYGSDAGISWAISQCNDLFRYGFKHIHFFTMNSDFVLKVVQAIL